MKIESPPLNLQKLAFQALEAAQPGSYIRAPGPRTGLFCWGKAAWVTAHAVSQRTLRAGRAVKMPSLVIAPSGPGFQLDRSRLPASMRGFLELRCVFGEHPLPGAGSFEAGLEVLEFFDRLRDSGARRLEVYLSGGASSLAWLPFPGVSRERLLAQLTALYRRPLPIGHLNRIRSRLCQLKGGGAARWLRALAPEVEVHVNVVSDVLPFGAQVVGSGPFWDGRIRHRVVADNELWVKRIAQLSPARILGLQAARSGPWTRWVSDLDAEIARCLQNNKHGLLIFGGEAQVDLRSKRSRTGSGGRLSQIAAALLQKRAREIAQQRVEILCLSSDGLDGGSASAGTWLGRQAGAMAIADPNGLASAVAALDTATWLRGASSLLPSRSTGTNVQDCVLVRVR